MNAFGHGYVIAMFRDVKHVECRSYDLLNKVATWLTLLYYIRIYLIYNGIKKEKKKFSKLEDIQLKNNNTLWVHVDI